MKFERVRSLSVWRTLSDGSRAAVGNLAQNKQGVYFQYHEDYLASYGNLSPFKLKPDGSLQAASSHVHNGLHGVFADSLPDGWGLLLQDRFFRQQGVLPSQVTAMDRLAFIGHSAIGALGYEPQNHWQNEDASIDFVQLGLQAQAVFDGHTDDVLQLLTAAGSSGGARPKAQIYTADNLAQSCRTVAQENDDAWIVKFTSRNLPLGHDEGICEAAYLKMAAEAGIQTVEWQLLPAPKESGAQFWLAVKRFDWVKQPKAAGRLHLLSAAGLLDADFRLPSLDYADLIKASKLLTKSPSVGKEQFKRSMFNLFGANQDDHSKNWAFLQQDSGQWIVSPFYDATFSPQQFGEHSTSYGGYGKQPPLKAIQQLAEIAGIDHWAEAKQIMEACSGSLTNFSRYAAGLGAEQSTVKLIQKHLNEVYQQNKHLLG